jgi:hypothetical protein
LSDIHLWKFPREIGGKVRYRFVSNVTPLRSDTSELVEEETPVCTDIQTIGVWWEPERQEQRQVVVVAPRTPFYRRALVTGKSSDEPVTIMRNMLSHT